MAASNVPSNAFAHLHLHSVYSLLDGACKIDELIEHIKSLGQKSVAITDHGNLYAAVIFAQAAEKAGIHAVIGCEVYVAARTRFDRENALDRKSDHLILLCENEKGYRNLVKLVTKSNIEGFYHRPRVDEELLREYSDGLICLSGCIAGKLARLILAGDYEKAKQTALMYRDIFGEKNYFIEIQNHGVKDEIKVLPSLYRLSSETGIPLVATNDAHYIKRSDAEMHRVLLCIQTGKTIQDEVGMGFETNEFYVKSTREMAELFLSVPEAILNTGKIAERCRVHFESGKIYLPKFESPDGMDSNKLFALLCKEGLIKKYGSHPSKEAVERIKYEMSVISRMGFVDYFLIVWDYVSFAKKNGIPVGPGRGSGAGSICAYCLDITQIDPIANHLLFERFLNPERVSMPDFDIDFCIEGRQAVKDYVIRRYGKDRVSEIITFDFMKARGAVRDTGRAMNMPYALCDKIAKMIDSRRTISETLEARDGEDLRQLCRTDTSAKRLIDMALCLEGVPRHTSTHAAGVIISAFPIEDMVPLQMNDDTVVTQYTMNTLESLGLLKFDFLGLRNLTVIRDCVKSILKNTPRFKMENISVTDENVYKMMSKGETTGVFQFESAGMKRVLMMLKPESLEDLTAVLSLYRPGPRDSIPKYIENRQHPESIKYAHPLLEPILNVTNGCIVYQEQVMEICRVLAGYSYGRADLVRRAMSKKKHDVMEKERQIFLYGDGQSIDGAVARGVPAETANKIFDEISGFASYAFNKSHAAAYAFLAYQTAYLKYYYFQDFMAALMTSVIGDTSKLMLYINLCENSGVKILPPHINSSDLVFKRHKDDICFGLLAVKNLGRSFIEKLVTERYENGSFTGIRDFCHRMSDKELNKRAVESLICCGAFDGLGLNRKQMHSNYESILAAYRESSSDMLDGQMNFFGTAVDNGVYDSPFPYESEFSQQELLRMEKEYTGMYLSGHPLAEYFIISKFLHTADFARILEEPELYQNKPTVSAVCIISELKRHITKKGDSMCFMKCEDSTGNIDCVVFPELFAASKQKLLLDKIVYITGRLDFKDESASLMCSSILNEDELKRKLDRSRLCCKLKSTDKEKMNMAVNIAIKHKGTIPICFYITDLKKTIAPKMKIETELSNEVFNELSEFLGDGNIGIV